jgi:ATP-binding protein involved in chromosome partitioning
VKVPIIGLIENMSYFTPAELPNNKYYLFGKQGGQNLATEYDLAFLGEIPLVQSIREGGDAGVPAMVGEEEISKAALRGVVSNAVRQIAIRNANLPKTETISVA